MPNRPRDPVAVPPPGVPGPAAPTTPSPEVQTPGGETHQVAGNGPRMTNKTGVVTSDDQNTLRQGPRGPALLEDQFFREKMTHFDHERIPERVVHARGSAAHGFFEPYREAAALSKARFLQDPARRTAVFVRFSTVAGSKGSKDLARDVRGFATRFYTEEGNFDLVGNNMPIFFIQDAIKFPDLVHSVKPEPDRGFPQAASAHDTFWDFISMMPESIHMSCWLMSDRAIPRSFRMMEGFGVNTFKLVDANDAFRFVKFHWRPKIGSAFVLWDEAVKISGADPDFHRRDLWESIERGDFPEFELSVQLLTQAEADAFDFDVLDATKIIPEEQFPRIPIGRMVLDRNPDNFFAETEQVAFHVGNVVPGIDFSNDPLLQGRLFSYIDTQLLRLGGPNFHQIPINRPQCPLANLQRDGFMQMERPAGRVNYEPSSIQPAGPREDAQRGFRSSEDRDSTPEKGRIRAESFADHYSQARQFFRSLTGPEQRHLVAAYGFELGKVETIDVRRRMLGHLALVDPALEQAVAAALGMEGQAMEVRPKVQPVDLPPSPALSLLAKQVPTLAGRKIGLLVTDGSGEATILAIEAAAQIECAAVARIAPRVGGISSAGGKHLNVHHALNGAPSVLFDAVILAPSAEGAARLAKEAAAQDFVRDAWGHAKIIGYTQGAAALLEGAAIGRDEGVTAIDADGGLAKFVAMASHARIWEREAQLRPRG
jgi:catalase